MTMRANLRFYQVMASVVGVLLVVLVLVGVPLANFDGTPMWGVFPSTPAWITVGSRPHEIGEFITSVLGVAHGWLYMILLITAVDLGRRAKWSWWRLLLIALAGTVPFLSFVAERSATRDVRAKLAGEKTEAPIGPVISE